MKRLLIRISTLATIVALGLIAIAQAQRGVEDRPQESETREPSSSAWLDEGVSGPIAASAERADVPGVFLGGPDINPLRSVARGAMPRDVIPTSAESGERYPSDSRAAYPAAIRPHDQFAVVAAVGTVDTTTGGESDQPGAAAELPGNVPPIGMGPQEGSVGSSRYPPLVGPAGSDAAPGAGAPTPAEPSSAGSLGGSRYGERITSAGDSREPGRLELDPSDPVSSLPHLPGLAAEGVAVPGAESVATEIGARTEGTGTPGNRELEGPQAPQLTIQKLAPEEIQVGKEATFQVKVTNTGQVAAHGVEVRDEIPKGTRLVSTSPRSSRDAQGGLVWLLDTMQPGEEASVEIRVMPTEEGEIGSVATVRFNADASARTVATRPELAIHTSAPSQVLIGEEMTLTITISNPGSGIAYDVVLEEHVPPGLRHVAGDELEYVVGDLKPNESRQLELTLTGDAAGVAANLLSARADANLKVEDRVEVEVIAPQLDVALDGPKRRFLEREATYTLSVSNPGTAPARNVELVAHLPTGLEFVSANNAGEYQPASRTVHWNLEELPAQEIGTVKLTTMPVEAGEQTLRFTSTGEPGLSVAGEQPILVEGFAAIVFQVVDEQDPIELGGETTYEIRVVNKGSKAATNVQLMALLPPGLEAIAAEGPARHAIEANRVIFEGLARLAPKADTTYRVRVQGRQPGDQRLSVQLLTDEMTTPVIKQESTRVYSDE